MHVSGTVASDNKVINSITKAELNWQNVHSFDNYEVLIIIIILELYNSDNKFKFNEANQRSTRS